MVTGGGWKKQLGSELKPLINDRINDRKHLEAGEGGEGRQVAGMVSPSSAQREPRAGGGHKDTSRPSPLVFCFCRRREEQTGCAWCAECYPQGPA